jgi:hypothetical protein
MKFKPPVESRKTATLNKNGTIKRGITQKRDGALFCPHTIIAEQQPQLTKPTSN